MNKHTPRMDYEAMSCKDIFTEITTRQLVALMFHSELSTYFTFLGLDGFKRLHEYQYYCESKGHRCSVKYFVTHYNWLIEPKNVTDPKVIPAEWFKYKRSDVSSSIKQKAVKDAFDMYLDWEKETKECYEHYAKMLMDNCDMAGASYVSEMVCEVEREIEKIEKLIIKMNSTNYDMVYIMDIQKCIHDKYKKKVKKLFG